ncbi:MAG: hypothetical protein SPF70_01790 [Lachnospiraceae bacterium]|nr:hypothetical protein [Lachnospiraceae bacterium]
MKAIKSTIIKLIILLVIFIVTVGSYFILTYEETEDPTETISTATLPVITMKYQKTDINLLHGYVGEMQGQYMRNVITPYGADNTVEMDIERYSNVIAAISYEVRTVDTTRLIDAQEVTEWVTDGEDIYVTLEMSGIMQSEEEYLLMIKLVTETHGDVYYYTHLKKTEENDIVNQLFFVNDFSQLAIENSATDKYGAYLEYDASQDNTNLAYVDIKSSYDNIDWGNLEVTRATKPVISVKELLGNIGCYELQYKVMARDEYGNEQYYNVTEYFRLRTVSSGMYLDVYERHANQIFNPDSTSISATRINLGLDDDLKLHYKTSPTGSFVTFVKEGSMFTLDMQNNKVTEVFSFEKLTEEDMRIDNNSFDIEILSTDAKGNTMFIVYGYMAKGAHEGQVGVALYQYNYEKNKVKELVFVPSDKPFDIFKDSVGKFAYMTEENLLYFMIGNSIYTVTMDSNEYVQLVTGLKDGNYIINEYNNILAWHENASVNDADTIRVINVDRKEDYTISAGEGDRIKVIGFIGNDMVYGTAHASDIYQDASGNTVFPMYKITVLVYEQENEDGIERESSEETYQKENIYVTDVSVKENVMTLTRKMKNADGSFSDIEEDKYVNKMGEDKEVVSLETISTELKKTELVLCLAYTITAENKLVSEQVKDIDFVTANTLNLNQSEYITDKYYVYGANGLEGIYSDAKAAITYANSIFGVVVEDSGKLFWGRINKPDLAKLADTTGLVAKAYTSLEQVKADENYEVTDISGVDFATLFYFGANQIPVITWINDYGCVILSAYSGYQGNIDTLAFTVCQTGEIIKMSYGDAKRALEEGGSRYLVVRERKTED